MTLEDLIEEKMYEDDMIYHYCSIDDFLSIISNNRLWLTDSSKINDTSESVWSVNFMDYALRKKLDSAYNCHFGEDDTALIRGAKNYLCCFSTDGNVLSQWQAYAKDGTGVAIGFDRKMLGFIKRDSAYPNVYVHENCRSLRLSHAIYDADLQWEIFERTIQENMEKGSDKKELFQQLLEDSVFNKNKAYEEEKEMRISVTSIEYPLQLPQFEKRKEHLSYLKELKFRSSKKGLSAYFTLVFPVESVSKIIVGPRNESAKEDIRHFLEVQGYDHNIDIVLFRDTYRNIR